MLLSLKAVRANANLSQSELGAYMHVSRQTVSRWENGVRELSKKELHDLCMICGVQESDIISFNNMQDNN